MNGYVRLIFVRQVQEGESGEWATVQRQRRSTRNTALKGAHGVIHWTQWFFPLAGDAGSRAARRSSSRGSATDPARIVWSSAGSPGSVPAS